MDCLKMITIWPKRKYKPLTKVQKDLMALGWKPGDPETGSITVPCGKCAYCLTNRRSSWMFRVYHEMRSQLVPGHFLTLTYDEKHVKRVGDGRLSLRFRDVQLFLKRVRKDKFYCKYICVGEYGGVTGRPHYHMLLWTDCPVEFLESYWQQGRIHFGRLTMASAMYTLKYIIQPKVKNDDFLEPTRAQFSKGIGLSYLSSEVYDWHTSAEYEPQVFCMVDGNKVGLPRYYKGKIFTRWQMKQQNQKVRKEAERRLEDVKRTLTARGIDEWLTYYQSLRVERANQILETTKYNLSL